MKIKIICAPSGYHIYVRKWWNLFWICIGKDLTLETVTKYLKENP